ncbi:sialate O-acetylesterase [Verrucomicrobia bacterium]|nr:sialate O-acetylesterase [Verrucomicrobiota bacterium]
MHVAKKVRASLFFNSIFVFLGLCSLEQVTGEPNGPVQVFILAGQSNMEGKGFPRPLSWQLGQAKYRERYLRFIKDGDDEAFLKTLHSSLAKNSRQPEYAWAERKDVWVDFHEQHGNLKVGYSPNRDCFGPEFNFGQVMGDLFEEPVLLIKTAWGGKALGREFLPPSLRNTNKKIKALAVREKKTVQEILDTYGVFYDLMIDEIKQSLLQLQKNHPDYQEQGYEIKGMVWFQGWNDLFDENYRKGYESNLTALIRDIRKDLNVPDLPVVIGQNGHDGDKKGAYPTDKDGNPDNHAIIRKAQWDAAQVSGFEGTVVCIRTAPFWDMDADAIYYGPGSWKKDVDKWRQFGDDRPYHYLGSPWFFAQTGTAFGQAMRLLLEQ